MGAEGGKASEAGARLAFSGHSKEGSVAGVEGTKGQALVDEVRACSGSWTCVKTGAFTPRQTPGLQPWSDLVHGVFQQVTLAAWRTDPGEVRAAEEADREGEPSHGPGTG